MKFPVLAHMLSADSAQPRNCSNVTRPFLVLWGGGRGVGEGVCAYKIITDIACVQYIPRPIILHTILSAHTLIAVHWE